MESAKRILLIDPSDAARCTLAERLQLQGFRITECRDGAEGAALALEAPPAAVIADMSMPSISGVQLCRLLKAERGTVDAPVILRGPEGRRNRFWAAQCGAYAYVVKGRMGELVGALRSAFSERSNAPTREECFSDSCPDGVDVRERIAGHLDAALFDSVVAAELRSLGTSESFGRMVDLLSQFLSQVTSYRWVALHRSHPPRLGLHSNPVRREESQAEARLELNIESDVPLLLVEDEDAIGDATGPDAIVEPIYFGSELLGSIALAPRAPAHHSDPLLVKTIARELGASLRMVNLVEESRMIATTDTLTGLLNRRAFVEWADREIKRSQRYKDQFAMIMLDVDHFKQINDRHGHAAGDVVLSSVGARLSAAVRSCDVVARWGGEEFLVALPSTPLHGANEVAERLRRELEQASITSRTGDSIPVTASLGVAQLQERETVEELTDRADRAMYEAKSSGRNRVAGERACEDAALTNARARPADR